ncbi:MAG: DNA-processing protein DprA [Paludibacteraceae bacterium]|nr:DNA-processing protein DprA [Paludibacteraceae bacterium]
MENSQERRYVLALAHLFSNRPRHLRQLKEMYGTAVETWKHINEQDMSAALRRADEEEEFIARHNISVWTEDDADYPQRLKECPDAPLLLFGKGNIRANKGKWVSVVGTRTCTDRGREITRQFVLELAQRCPDLTIVSGLAYGIDIAAHKAALEAGIPTVIIAGHGLDRIYPAVHRNIAVASLKEGGILTEYMSRTDPERYNFVARDRIIAGISEAVVIVESKEKGGSLITAGMANDYNRSLFAFPGRAQDETSRGCNRLIRDQKAALIEGADDFLRLMMWDTLNPPAVQAEIPMRIELTGNEQIVLAKLREQEDGMQINYVVQETRLPYPDVSSALMMLEMKNLAKSLPGGIYRALIQ